MTHSIQQQQQHPGRNQCQLQQKYLVQNKSCLVGKENMCINQDAKLAPTDMIKSGMQKFTKFIKSQKSQIMNSNNINVRRNYGSNDSTQQAPAQKKYVITHKFN